MKLLLSRLFEKKVNEKDEYIVNIGKRITQLMEENDMNHENNKLFNKVANIYIQARMDLLAELEKEI